MEKTVSFRLDKELYLYLKNLCEANDIPMSKYIRDIIEKSILNKEVR